MAQPTSTLPEDERIQDDYNERFNEISKNLGDLEGATTDNMDDYEKSFANPTASDQEDSNVTKAQDVLSEKEGQGSPLTATNFTNNVKPKDVVKQVSKLRKFAPTIGVSGLIIGVVSGLSMLLSPSMLFIHIKETLMDRFNIQSTALDTRANKILAKKMASMTTSCSKLTYACKMNSLNKTTLKKMVNEGIIPVDKNGRAIEIKSDYGSQRPDGYQIKNLETSELSRTYSADEINALINGKDPALAGRFRNVFDVNWSSFWDETFSGFMGREGLKRSSMLTGETEEDLKKSYQSEVDGKAKTTTLDASSSSDPNATDAQKATAAGDVNAASGDVNAAVKKVATEGDAAIDTVSKQLAMDATKKVGKSGGAMLIASLYCGGSDFLKMLGSTTRAAQIAQGIVIAYTFAQVADEIKSGNADQTALSAKVSFLGLMLTSVVKDSKGNITKKSGMDSAGMGYLLRGDSPKVTSTSDYTKYIPGGWSSVLSSISQKSSNPQTNEACKLFNSTGGQLAQLALDFNPVGIAMFIGTTVFQTQIADLMTPLISGMVKSLAGVIVPSGTVAEDLGNALGVFMPMMMSEAGNAGGLMAFPKTSTGQAAALAYAKQNEATVLANARIDQATISPLDATSSNTALGSIVSSILPYYSGFSSSTGLFSSIQSIVGSSLSNIISPKTHASTSSLVGNCPDPSINVVSGPVCNVLYGAPTELLNNIDPDNVISYLSGQIDDTTGDMKSDSAVKKWHDLCATGSGTSVYDPSCVLTDADIQASKTSTPTPIDYYMLYSIDNRIQHNMDGLDPLDGHTGSSAPTIDNIITPSSAIIGDDYKIDSTKYAYGSKQCVDFVLYRLVKHGVLPGIIALGNGKNVVGTLGKLGFKVDTTPALHSVMSTPDTSQPQYGHTAIVAGINADGSFTVEEYNYTRTLQYDSRVIPASDIAAKHMTFAHTETKYQ